MIIEVWFLSRENSIFVGDYNREKFEHRIQKKLLLKITFELKLT